MALSIAEQREAAGIGDACLYVVTLDNIWTTQLAAAVPEPGSAAASELIDVGTEMATVLTHIHERGYLLHRFDAEFDELFGPHAKALSEQLDVTPENLHQHLREAVQHVDQYAPEEAKGILAKIDLIRSGEATPGDVKIPMRGALLIIGGVILLGAGIAVVACGVEDLGGPLQRTLGKVGGEMFKQGLQDFRAGR
ncbi:hypothetical protein [Streptomyces sp. NPDC000405]|uniref:hypothetical protein n=1 Tax=Streptomyces sp. NPDC000405 TaxID=3161033 RepID=UPI00398CEECC